MTILAFPDTTGKPTDGSFTYEENGVIYSWTGEYWAANNAQGFDQRYVNADGDQMTGDLTVPSLNGGPLSGLRNALINADFSIWQRSNNAGGTGYRAADRWRLGGNAPNLLRIYPASDIGLPCGAAGRLTGTTGADASLIQAVELATSGRPAPFMFGSQWTLSFYSTFATTDIFLRFAVGSNDQTDAVEFTKGEVTTIQTLSSGWARYSVTFTAPNSIAGSHACARLIIGGPADGSAMDITGVQLEPGPVATPLEVRPYGLELSLCQRYFYKFDNGGQNTGLFMTTFMGGSSTRSGCVVPLPVAMRQMPTVTDLDVRNNPSAYINSINSGNNDCLVIASNDDNSTSNQFPAVKRFNADAEL